MLTINEQEYASNVDIGRQQSIMMTGVSYAVIDKYKDMVYRAAITTVRNFADAEDIMQDVFLKYFRTHPTFESEEHEKAWFLRVTINEGKNLLRSAWHSRRVSADLSATAAESEMPVERSEVLEAVLSLPEKYRMVIYLYYYEDYSIRQVSRLLSCTEAAVAQRLSRGRKKLEKKLGGYRR